MMQRNRVGRLEALLQNICGVRCGRCELVLQIGEQPLLLGAGQIAQGFAVAESVLVATQSDAVVGGVDEGLEHVVGRVVERARDPLDRRCDLPDPLVQTLQLLGERPIGLLTDVQLHAILLPPITPSCSMSAAKTVFPRRGAGNHSVE